MKNLGCALALLLVALLGGCTSSDRPDSVPAAGKKGRHIPRLTDVSAEAGLGGFRHENGAFGAMWFPEQMGAGGGFIDYDGDGWQDILLVGGGALEPNTVDDVPALWLYRNNGDGTFTEQNAEAGLSSLRAYGTGIVAADYDNDGDQDFFFTTVHQNYLFRNDGGRFAEVTVDAGLAEPVRWSGSAVFFDADKDGWLDLYVANYADWSPSIEVPCWVEGNVKVYCPPGAYKGIPSVFYHNNGDGTFSEMTDTAGFGQSPGKSLGVAEYDFNRDGWSDLVVAEDGERDLLYESNGDGTFTEKGTLSGMAYGEYGEARAGMGIDVGVVDSSGHASIFVGNFSEEMIGVYRYTGDGWFIDRAAASKIGRSTLMALTFGLFLLDFDFDGDLDLLAANGHVYPKRTNFMGSITYKQPAQLFLNNGNGVFSEANALVGGALQTRMVARAAAFGDYNRDGAPDVLLTENGGPVHLWRNGFRDPHFLRVKLQGTKSNRDAIGARITAVVAGRHMERRVRTGSSYLSNSEKIVTFGLGAQTRVDTLHIVWPSSRRDRFTNVPGNQEILVVEETGAYVPRRLPGRAKAGAGGH